MYHNIKGNIYQRKVFRTEVKKMENKRIFRIEVKKKKVAKKQWIKYFIKTTQREWKESKIWNDYIGEFKVSKRNWINNTTELK